MLKGKVAIVTGSTSGIGLAIARALAEAGCGVMLNGFGKASEIERECAQIANDFGVRVAFNSADLATRAEVVQGCVLTPLVEKKITDRAARENISVDQAKINLLSEKQPSHEFATPEQIGALTVFLCSNAAAQIRGAALPVDGGWTAQ